MPSGCNFENEEHYLSMELRGILTVQSPTVERGAPGVDVSGVRFSRRLVGMGATPIFDKAIARRARLEQFRCIGGGRRTLRNRKKIQIKSARCRVLINEGETNSFMEFVSHKD